VQGPDRRAIEFRQRPLHAFGGLGLWLAAPGVLMLGWLFVLKLFGEDIGGRPLLLVGVMLVLMGVQLIAAGLIGELLTRIYHEAGGVPQFHAEEYVPGDEKNGGLARADTAPPATSLIA